MPDEVWRSELVTEEHGKYHSHLEPCSDSRKHASVLSSCRRRGAMLWRWCNAASAKTAVMGPRIPNVHASQ